MPNVLKCPSSGYSYNFSGESKAGTGNTEAAANANALSKFDGNAESAAQLSAITDATTQNNCEGTCSLNISAGKSFFKQTAKTSIPPTGAPTTINVTVTIQVPITLGCSQRTVTAFADFNEIPINVAIATLASVRVADISILSPLADRLSEFRVETVGDLLDMGRRQSTV
jgi:hypothetical protein